MKNIGKWVLEEYNTRRQKSQWIPRNDLRKSFYDIAGVS